MLIHTTHGFLNSRRQSLSVVTDSSICCTDSSIYWAAARMLRLLNHTMLLKQHPTLRKLCGFATFYQVKFHRHGSRHIVTNLIGEERALRRVYVNVGSSYSMCFSKIGQLMRYNRNFHRIVRSLVLSITIGASTTAVIYRAQPWRSGH